MNKLFVTIFLVIASTALMAQIRPPAQSLRGATPSRSDEISYLNPKSYIIGGTTVTGAQYLDKDILVTISKLTKGQNITVPGEATSNAVKLLWQQGLFDDVQLNIERIKEDSIFFNINVVERPRLSRIDLKGISKSQKEDIQKKLNDNTNKVVGKIVNENLLNTVTNTINTHLNEKGYLFNTVDIKQIKDTVEANNVILDIDVDRNSKVKVHRINFEGNKEFKNAQLRKYLKKTHQKAFYKVFGSGKFLRAKYEEDKKNLIAKMQDKGFRDAELLSDTVKRYNSKSVDIDIKLYEGPKYYFGNITWAGNAKYPTSVLNSILSIKKGEIFSEEKLGKKLQGGGPSGDDVSSLYMNDGYLTFNVEPVQTKIYTDTVDLEIRIYEGPQYTVNKISLRGNDITNDKVVMREIRTKPGQKFNKDLVIRTTREIATLGNFDDTKTDVKPIPNPADGTVDIEYTVAEKPSDQVELSGGFGGGRIIGTLGLTFNNFSTKNIFNLKEWKPLPRGDGQKLSLRGQTNGKQYQSYSFSFSEPWFGGKKPVYFGISAFTSLSSNQFSRNISAAQLQRIRLNGITFSLGQRLKWPDDYFQINHSINLEQYKLTNYPGFLFSTGTSYNLSLQQEISRNSIDVPLYPKSGSNIRFTIQATPPFSLFNNLNYNRATQQEKYRFTEYHKWKFEAQWFQRIYGNLVFRAQAQLGFLGYYNDQVGQSAFERFKLGGDGMQGFDFLQGSEIIGMRGYENNSVIPDGSSAVIARNSGSPIFNKFIMEVRHPVSLSQQATIYVLAFAEGGNTWNRFQDYNPFNVRRSVGVGARIFLPIFGLLGIDYGYGFDRIPDIPTANRGQFHFSIAQQIGGFNN